MNSHPGGTLYIVPTPIGNLDDMTHRAVEVLKSVDLAACEDTRTSAILFSHYDIETSRTSFHVHNEHGKTPSIIDKLRDGLDIALVSDAGMPGISDPGYLLTRAAVEANIPVIALPGPTAFVPALAASGLPSDRFIFEGFMPPRKGRIKRLTELSDEERTLVFYESPHRIEKLLSQIVEVLGSERPVVIAREITKKFEEYLRGSAGQLAERLRAERLKGEMVVIVGGTTMHGRKFEPESHNPQ